MKPFGLFVLLPLLLLTASCSSLTYFESPNSLRNIYGTLYLQNGKTVEGRLVVQTDNLLGSPVKVYTEGDKKPMQFSLSAIKGYTARNQTYELREIKEGLNFGRRLLFMRRLTPDNSRMHLFEYMEKHTVNKTATRYEHEYYMQLPGEQEGLVYSVHGSRFVPNFEEKMSGLVADCPSLSQKIKEKSHGYFYAQVTVFPEKRVEVLQRIVEEYNQCEMKKGQ
jgi:hypothetical protein